MTIGHQTGIRRSTWLWLALIVALAAVMRFTDLEHVPVGGDGDAAWISMNALDWVDRGVWPYYIREMYAPEPWTVYLIGLAIPLTGILNMTPRFVTALSGVLMVAALFPATWWLLGDNISRKFRERASLLAALAGAVSLHAMHLSRLGVQAPNLPLAIVLTTWLTAWAWRRGGYGRWILAGAALALTQYIYISGRVMPVVLILWATHSLYFHRESFRQRWRGWMVMAATAFFLVLPNLITFVVTPEAFTGRADAATASTGGLIWNYDLSTFGGIGGLLLKKLGLILQAVGIYWDGPYTGMGQPMLAPLFFVGLLVVIPAAIKYFRNTIYGWSLLAILAFILPDLFTGAVVEAHSLRQIGALPFVFILAGLGLAYAWEWLDKRLSGVRSGRYLGVVIVVLAVAPSLWGMYRYFHDYAPERYADPETAWRAEQTDVDISRRILEAPEQAWLLPYDEYNRANESWLLSSNFRERGSAIETDGILHVENLPNDITLVTASDPYRARHDARPSQWDTRLWVLLYDGHTYLLPPLTAGQKSAVLDILADTEPEILFDRSETDIAHLYTAPTPEGLFAEREVIDHPMDAVFRLPGTDQADEARLVGYTLPDINLKPGELLYVTLFWQALKHTSEDYEVFVQIRDDAGTVIAGTHDFPYGGAYRSRIWQTDEIVATHHWMQLPDDLPAGRYTLAAGLYRQLHNEPLVVAGSSASADQTAALAHDLRYPAPPMNENGTPPPTPLEFGDLFAVAGLDATRNGAPQIIGDTWTMQPGDSLTVDIAWDVLERPPVDYSLFLHLMAADNAPPSAQADLPLGAGLYPSGVWYPGDELRDSVTLTLPDDLAPGDYTLWMGVYYYADGSRLTPILDGENQPDGRVQLAMVRISP